MKKLLLIALVALSASQMHAMNLGDVTTAEEVQAAKATAYFALPQERQPAEAVQTPPLPYVVWQCPKDCPVDKAEQSRRAERRAARRSIREGGIYYECPKDCPYKS